MRPGLRTTNQPPSPSLGRSSSSLARLLATTCSRHPCLPAPAQTHRATPCHCLQKSAKIAFHRGPLCCGAGQKQGLFTPKFIISRHFLPCNYIFRASWLEIVSLVGRPTALQWASPSLLHTQLASSSSPWNAYLFLWQHLFPPPD